MTLCKFGIHDVEIVSAQQEVDDFIANHMKLRGFEYQKGTGAWAVNIWQKEIEYGTLIIREQGYLDDSGSIAICLPFRKPIKKICLKCKKIKINYNLNTISENLNHLIYNKTNDLKRKFQAREILKLTSE